MAKQIDQKKPTLPTADQFNKLLKKLTISEAEINDAKAKMGGDVEAAIERHNFHKDALRVVRKYCKKAPAAAAEFLLHFDLYWEFARLSVPEEDLLETPSERTAKAKRETKKPTRQELGKPSHKIDDGKVVPIESEEAA